MKKKINTSHIIWYCSAFVISVTILCVVFAIQGIYPFYITEDSGERVHKSILTMDLWQQYVPFLSAKYYNIHTGGSPFWTWNGGLGLNLLVQDAYYTNSFFNLLLLPFARASLINVMHFTVILKYGCITLAFCAFLHIRNKKLDLLTVAFSLAYTFCGYSMAFISQVMWTDLIMITPLVILGLERLIVKQKPLLYLVTLFFSLYLNYYVAFSLCIFLVLYFLCYIIGNASQIGKPKLKKAFWNFAVFSLLAGALAAFILLPVLKGQSDSLYTDNDGFGLTWYNSFIEYFAKLMPGARFTLVWEVPNIYSSIAALLLVPLLFFNRKFSLGKKISYATFIAILFISMNHKVFMRLWHGGRFPNQLNGRWTYLFSFLVILIAYEAIRNIKYVDRRAIIASVFFPVLMLVGARANTDWRYAVNEKTAVYTVIVLIAYTVLLLCARFLKRSSLRSFAVSGIALLLIGEVALNTVSVMTFHETDEAGNNRENMGISTLKNFDGSLDKITQIKYQYASPSNDFYRMEMNPAMTFNNGQTYDYKALTTYSSSEPAGLYTLFESLGNKVYTKNRSSLYVPDYPINNALFNVKYVVSLSGKNSIAGLTEISSADYTVYENDYYLPLAFKASNKVLNWRPNSNLAYFENQNDFANAVYGEELDIYSSQNLGEPSVINASLSVWNNGFPHYVADDINQKVVIEYRFKIDQDGDYYLSNGIKSGLIGVIQNGVNTTTEPADENHKLINLGKFNQGDDVVLHFESTGISVGIFELDMFFLNNDKMEMFHEKLSQGGAQIIEAKDTKIRMNLQTNEGGLVYTSIPADGWEVKIGGKKVDKYVAAGYLLAFSVPAGNNDIEISYHCPGFSQGLVISIMALLICAVYFLNDKFKFGTKTGNKILLALEKYSADEEIDIDTEPVIETDKSDVTLRDFSFESYFVFPEPEKEVYEEIEEELQEEIQEDLQDNMQEDTEEEIQNDI